MKTEHRRLHVRSNHATYLIQYGREDVLLVSDMHTATCFMRDGGMCLSYLAQIDQIIHLGRRVASR